MDYWLYVFSLVSTSPKVVTVSFRGGRIPTYLFIHKRYYLTGQESIVLGQLFILSHWSNIPIYDDVSWQGRYYNRWSYPLSSGGQSNLPPKLPEFIEGLNGAIFPLVLPCLSYSYPPTLYSYCTRVIPCPEGLFPEQISTSNYLNLNFGTHSKYVAAFVFV